MKRYSKNTYAFPQKEALDVSTHFVNQTFSCDCFHCGRTTTVFVPLEFTDWESIAKDYQTMYEKALAGFNETMRDMDAMYGGDNVAAVYFKNKILMIKLEIEKEIRDGKWKK